MSLSHVLYVGETGIRNYQAKHLQSFIIIMFVVSIRFIQNGNVFFNSHGAILEVTTVDFHLLLWLRMNVIQVHRNVCGFTASKNMQVLLRSFLCKYEMISCIHHTILYLHKRGLNKNCIFFKAVKPQKFLWNC